MIWLTWRQHRKQALFAVIGLAVLAAILIPTGLQIRNGLDETGLNECIRAAGKADFVDPDLSEICGQANDAFNREYASFTFVAVLLFFPPLLAGMFWGATLVAQEVEHGTHRLVWTQGVSRMRWLLVKGGLVTAGTTILAAAYTLLVSWWLTPLATATTGRLTFPVFDLAGLAPVGYAVFAVVLGVFAGAVSRKVLPAMAITLAGFVAARAAVAIVRPRFQAPLELRFAADSGLMHNERRGDWVLSEQSYDAAGNFLANATARCIDGPRPGASAREELMCGVNNVLTYHPWDRFWPFQYLEIGIFAALAVVLAVLAVYQVRRRIT